MNMVSLFEWLMRRIRIALSARHLFENYARTVIQVRTRSFEFV
jgi:hypothetical protein